ncbi:MAG: MlaD family protein [Candidatus Gastranaerophilales bacterium]|nr:MlaD family protein [Candidatus Gastranaerophilales bacterium]MCM1072649.1 MlaD family protein [Bacteroides sp.]
MKLSSSFKVGILTIVALSIFLFTVLWVKGRAFSAAERIEVQFKDVNGMRPGSGVQMMGLRVGQVEEIIPVVEDETSYVKMRFVITNPDIKIPKASMLSIQQSGLIGEQFLEITPPRLRPVYIPVVNQELLPSDADVEIKLDEKYYNVGKVKKSQIMSAKLVPDALKDTIKTKDAYKVEYFVNLPGLILPEFMKGKIVTSDGVKKLRIEPLDGTLLPYPLQTSPYTVVEPMRIADFMDLQYKAAESLTETNRIVNELLNDKMIADLTQSVANFKTLTAQATTTLEKAEKLIVTSKNDLDAMIWMMTDATNNFNRLATNINGIVADENFKPALYDTADAINKLSKTLTPIIGSVDAKAFAEDLNASMKNINEITASVNSMTKDENLKKKLNDSVDNLNITMCEVTRALETVNGNGDKENLKQIMNDTSATVGNLKKFSEKLNKRFLLFRLMF